MSTPESILTKVKLLFNLANSPNLNEAASARAMADKLISKYNITEEELAALKEKPSPFTNDNKLYDTLGLSSWRQQLALAIAKHFYCQIVQEKCVPTNGIEQYNYYVFGEPGDVESIRFVYPAFTKKVDELVNTKCMGRGPVYVTSYCEGVAEAIVNNIHWHGIDLPDLKSPSRAIPTTEVDPSQAGKMALHKEEAKPHAEDTVHVESQRDLIKDIGAYFKGMNDGKGVSFHDILELEAKNEEARRLQEAKEDEKTP